MQETDTGKSLIKASNKKLILWLALFYVISDFIALALGVGYLLIVVGLHVLGRLAILYYLPLRKKLFTLLGSNKTSQIQMNWWKLLSVTLNVIVAIAIIAIGFWIILQNTFCQQNLFCLFMKNS